MRNHVWFAALCLSFRAATAGADELVDGFTSPPRAARPHTFWHWMNGNVAKEGITADLEAMKEAGIGGVFLFQIEGHLVKSMPVHVEKPWSQALRFLGAGTTVFESGKDGYHTYRIPALLETSSGTLLAFCEGRKKGQGDSGDIDLLLKRSQDGGATWGPQQVVWDEGADTCGNPCAVEDGTTREIILLLTRNDGRDREADIIDGKSRGTRTVWIAKSTTKGATWSPPVEITSAAKKPDWTWYATGPGAGIQLRRGKHEGRLVIPCDHIVSGTKKYYSHVILSDDHGKSWRIGGTSPVDGVNECQVAELDDGRLILNMRNYDRKQTCRAVCFSRDGGETWTDFGHDAALVEPICHASLIRLHGAPASDGGVLLFSNPADPKARRRMTLKLSRDGGRTWGDSLVLFEGPSAYSSLAALSDGSAGCLLEAGEKGPYETIIFRAVAVR